MNLQFIDWSEDYFDHSFAEIITVLRKCNFWDSNTIDLGYLRTDYTEKINDYIDIFLAGNR